MKARQVQGRNTSLPGIQIFVPNGLSKRFTWDTWNSCRNTHAWTSLFGWFQYGSFVYRLVLSRSNLLWSYTAALLRQRHQSHELPPHFGGLIICQHASSAIKHDEENKSSASQNSFCFKAFYCFNSDSCDYCRLISPVPSYSLPSVSNGVCAFSSSP